MPAFKAQAAVPWVSRVRFQAALLQLCLSLKAEVQNESPDQLEPLLLGGGGGLCVRARWWRQRRRMAAQPVIVYVPSSDLA